MNTKLRYEFLDALRGVAALAVVGFHFGQVQIVKGFVPHGYLAVDFFFVLSGFVIANAYENRLKSGMSWWDFVLKRLVRLYPLAIVGGLMGFAILMLKWRVAPDKVDPLPQILTSGLLNSLLIPMPFGGATSRHEIFPGNGPLWSLSFELVANLVWAAWGPWARNRQLICLVAVSGLVLVAAILFAGTANQGFDLRTSFVALARVSFGFTVGVLLCRLHKSEYWPGSIPNHRVMPVALSAAMIAILAFPKNAAIPVAAWDIVSIILFLPLIVLLGIAQTHSVRSGRLLGELSYPIYIIHFPLLLLASGLQQTVLSRLPPYAMMLETCVVVVALSFYASRLFDIPIRTFLTHRIDTLRRPRAVALPHTT